MATRSTIALEYADGTVDMIYCHWDGYLDHNGVILEKHWKDPFKLQTMMQLGDMSCMGKDVGVQHAFDERNQYDEEHIATQCTFYGRDRNESRTQARRFKSYEDYRANSQNEEFNYCLRNIEGVATWFVEFYGEFNGKLTEAMAQKDMEAVA
jgi:hypothetical protein